MKIVLLTGATGYIGRYAGRILVEKGFTVHAVSSKLLSEKEKENLVWHQADLLNTIEVENLIETIQPTHLLHLAWYVEHGKFWNAPENLDWLRASIFLAQKFAEKGGKRLVMAGTCAEYDWAAKNPFVENKTQMIPQTLYGASKYALYLALKEFAKIANLSFASGRIFFPFGGGESLNRLIPSVIRALLEKRSAKTSHGEQIRDFMYVEDVAEAFGDLLESDVCDAVNIASGKGIKLKEIIETIGEITGRPELLQIGALPANQSEPPEIIADIQRLRTEVKFNKEFDLRDRLKETIDYWKKVYEIND